MQYCLIANTCTNTNANAAWLGLYLSKIVQNPKFVQTDISQHNFPHMVPTSPKMYSPVRAQSIAGVSHSSSNLTTWESKWFSSKQHQKMLLLLMLMYYLLGLTLGEGFSTRVNQREIDRSKCIFKIVEIMHRFGSRFQSILPQHVLYHMQHSRSFSYS